MKTTHRTESDGGSVAQCARKAEEKEEEEASKKIVQFKVLIR